MEARGVEEGERELGCAAEMEEELDEKIPEETHAAAGKELQWRLDRVEGVVVREEERASSSAARDEAMDGARGGGPRG